VDIYQIMLPVKVCFGVGSLDTLEDEANKLAVKHALIVTDSGVYKAGLVDPVKQQLSRAKLSVDVFSEAEPEPTLPRLNAAAEKLGKESYDLLVGVGGGSSMDTAKGLSLQEAAEKGVEAFKTLAADIDIPLHLQDLGIPREALEEMAVATMEVTRLLANNPKKLTLDDVRRIWQNAW